MGVNILPKYSGKPEKVKNLTTISEDKTKEKTETDAATYDNCTMAEKLELYRLMVETVSANEARRQQMMTLYVSLFVAGFAALGSIEALDPLYLVVPALALSIVWYSSLRYFRALATAKFAVISHLEEDFPIKPFDMERKATPKRKLELSQLEMMLPALTILACMLYIVARNLNWLH